MSKPQARRHENQLYRENKKALQPIDGGAPMKLGDPKNYFEYSTSVVVCWVVSISWNFGSGRRRGGLGSPVQQQEAAVRTKAEARRAERIRIILSEAGVFGLRQAVSGIFQEKTSGLALPQKAAEPGTLLGRRLISRLRWSRGSAWAAGSCKKNASCGCSERGHFNEFHVRFGFVVSYYQQ